MRKQPVRLICMYCGEAYETTAGNSKFCSYECAYKNARDRRQAWEAMNPDYYKQYRQAQRHRATDTAAECRQVT